MKRNGLTLLCATAACLLGCGDGEAELSDANVGRVMLQIAQVPSDVHCLSLTVVGGSRTVTRNLTVTPGDTVSAMVDGLPTGTVQLAAAAYALDCSAVTIASIADWLGDPASQTITVLTGTVQPVNVVLRPNGVITPNIDWQADVDAEVSSSCNVEPTATVSSSAELSQAIGNATNGGVIWLNPGTYSCVSVQNRAFTQQQPLVICKNPKQSGTVTFDGNTGCYYIARIISSSYVVLDGLTIDGRHGTNIGVQVEASDHVLLRNLTISATGQEGIHVRKNSSYVDIYGSRVSDTGAVNPQWAECIYVGTSGNTDFPDETHHVWIEGNVISGCGAAEGINVKSETFHVTARGNTIYDITPGTPSQYNQAAITVEGYARSEPDQPTVSRDVWLENNTIFNVTYGQWASGIMVGGTGVYLVGNRITNCQEYGIYVNGFGDLGLGVWLYDNQVNAQGKADVFYSLTNGVHTTDPGPNPNVPQVWYGP